MPHRRARSSPDRDGNRNEDRSKSSKQASPGAQGMGGQRLSAAFEAVNTLPALAETSARVARLTAQGGRRPSPRSPSSSSRTQRMAIAVMKSRQQRRRSQRGSDLQRPRRGRVSCPPPASASITSLAGDLRPAGRRRGRWALLPERFRRHAVATRHAADVPRQPGRRPRPRRARDRRAPARRRPARPDAPLSRLRRRSSAIANQPRSGVAQARTPRARHRPHARGRRPHASLGAADGHRKCDRAPSLGLRDRPRRSRAPQPTSSPTTRAGDLVSVRRR